jgi:hypothetical protein
MEPHVQNPCLPQAGVSCATAICATFRSYDGAFLLSISIEVFLATEKRGSRHPSVMVVNTLGPEGGLLKLFGHRPVLPGKEVSFLLCPLDPAYAKAGIPGHLPATRSGRAADSLLVERFYSPFILLPRIDIDNHPF